MAGSEGSVRLKPRTGLFGTRPVSTHHRKKVFSGRVMDANRLHGLTRADEGALDAEGG